MSLVEFMKEVCNELQNQSRLLDKMEKTIEKMNFSALIEMRDQIEGLDIAICKLLQATKANQFSLAHLEQRERNGQKHT